VWDRSQTSFQCRPACRSRIWRPGPGVHAPDAFLNFSSNPMTFQCGASLQLDALANISRQDP